MRLRDWFKGLEGAGDSQSSESIFRTSLDKLRKKSPSKTNMRKWRDQFYKTEPFPTSPLNLRKEFALTLHLPPLEWHNFENAPYSSKIINSGHTTVVKGSWYEGKKKPYLSGGPLLDQKYVFYHTHFHWGESEHAVQGKIFPMEVHSVFFNNKYKTYEMALKETDGILIVAKFCRLIPGVPERNHRTFRIRDLLNGNRHVILYSDEKHADLNRSQVSEGRLKIYSEDKKSNISKNSSNPLQTKSVQSSQCIVESVNEFIEEVAKNIRFVRSVNTSKLIHAHSVDQLLPKFTGDYFFYLSGIRRQQTTHRVTWIVDDKNYLLISKAQLKSFQILGYIRKNSRRTKHDSCSPGIMFYIVNHAENAEGILSFYNGSSSHEIKSENANNKKVPKKPEEMSKEEELNLKCFNKCLIQFEDAVNVTNEHSSSNLSKEIIPDQINNLEISKQCDAPTTSLVEEMTTEGLQESSTHATGQKKKTSHDPKIASVEEILVVEMAETAVENTKAGTVNGMSSTEIVYCSVDDSQVSVKRNESIVTMKEILQTSIQSKSNALEKEDLQTSNKGILNISEKKNLQISIQSKSNELEKEDLQTSNKSIPNISEKKNLQISIQSKSNELEKEDLQTSNKSIPNISEKKDFQISIQSKSNTLEEEELQTLNKIIPNISEKKDLQTSIQSMSNTLEKEDLQTSNKIIPNMSEKKDLQSSIQSKSNTLEKEDLQTSKQIISNVSKKKYLQKSIQRKLTMFKKEDLQSSNKSKPNTKKGDLQTSIQSKTSTLEKGDLQTSIQSITNTSKKEDLQISIQRKPDNPKKTDLHTLIQNIVNTEDLQKERKNCSNIPVKQTASKNDPNRKKRLPTVVENELNTSVKDELKGVLHFDSSKLVKDELNIVLQNYPNTPRRQKLQEMEIKSHSNTILEKQQKTVTKKYSSRWVKMEMQVMQPALKSVCEIDRSADSKPNINNLKSNRFLEHDDDSYLLRRKLEPKSECGNNMSDNFSTPTSTSINLTSRIEGILLSDFYHTYCHEMCKTFFNDILKSINFTIEIPYCSRSESLLNTSLESTSITPSELSSSDPFTADHNDLELELVPSTVPSYRLPISCPFNKILNMLLPLDTMLFTPTSNTKRGSMIRKEKKENSLTKSEKKWCNLKSKYKIRNLQGSTISNVMSISIQENGIDVSRIIWNISDSGDADTRSVSIDDFVKKNEIICEESSSVNYFDSSIFGSISVPTCFIDLERADIKYSFESAADKIIPAESALDEDHVDSRTALESKIPRPTNLPFGMKPHDVFLMEQKTFRMKSGSLTRLRAPSSAPAHITTRTPAMNGQGVFTRRPSTEPTKICNPGQKNLTGSDSLSKNKVFRPPKYKKLRIRKRLTDNQISNEIVKHPDNTANKKSDDPDKLESLDSSSLQNSVAKIRRTQAFAKKYKLRPRPQSAQDAK